MGHVHSTGIQKLVPAPVDNPDPSVSRNDAPVTEWPLKHVNLEEDIPCRLEHNTNSGEFLPFREPSAETCDVLTTPDDSLFKTLYEVTGGESRGWVLKIKVGGKEVTAVIDSGAEKSVLREDIAKTTGLDDHSHEMAEVKGAFPGNSSRVRLLKRHTDLYWRQNIYCGCDTVNFKC